MAELGGWGADDGRLGGDIRVKGPLGRRRVGIGEGFGGMIPIKESILVEPVDLVLGRDEERLSRLNQGFADHLPPTAHSE